MRMASDTETPDVADRIALLERDGWKVRREAPFMDMLGPILTKKPLDERPRLHGFLAQPKHCNLNGIVHGGMLVAFADQVLGLTVQTVNRNMPQLTVHLGMDFTGAIEVGEFVQADCELVHTGNSIVFVRGTFSVGARPVGAATGVYKKLKKWRNGGPKLADETSGQPGALE